MFPAIFYAPAGCRPAFLDSWIEDVRTEREWRNAGFILVPSPYCHDGGSASA